MNWETDWLEARSRLSPDQEAIFDAHANQRWTYKQLNDRAVSLATRLQEEGLKKGDRLALLSPNTSRYLELLFACGKMGCLFVPLNWRLSAVELDYILKDCNPSLLFVHPSLNHLTHELDVQKIVSIEEDYEKEWVSYEKSKNPSHPLHPPVLSPDEGWAIIYTGGTTGKPKGVVLSHRAMNWNAWNTILSWNLNGEDVTLTYLPMFHTGGLNALTLPILMIGGKVVIGGQFDSSEALRLLNEERCTISLMVPTMYHMLIHDPNFEKTSFPTMKTFLSGGASCPHTIYEAFERRGIAFKEGYGLTEAGPNNFFIDPKDAQKKHGSVGKPMMFNQVRLMDSTGSEIKQAEVVGELHIQGYHVFDSYWENETATQEAKPDNWLHTGDLAKRDRDGDYYILGRQKDMIITGGENVYPLEVENVIQNHPAVNEVAVVGLPDELWGERVTAVIVLNPGYPLTEQMVREHCLKRLGRYKIPRQLVFVEELPKTDVGKIDKKRIVREAMEGMIQ